VVPDHRQNRDGAQSVQAPKAPGPLPRGKGRPFPHLDGSCWLPFGFWPEPITKGKRVGAIVGATLAIRCRHQQELDGQCFHFCDAKAEIQAENQRYSYDGCSFYDTSILFSNQPAGFGITNRQG